MRHRDVDFINIYLDVRFRFSLKYIFTFYSLCQTYYYIVLFLSFFFDTPGADLGFIEGGSNERPPRTGVSKKNLVLSGILVLENSFSSILGSKPKGIYY